MGPAVSVGPIFWLALGLYLEPITAESASFSIASVANVLVLPVAGLLVDRFGPLQIIFIGMTLLCAMHAAFSLVHAYVEFIALACVVAMAGCLASYPASLALPSRWFDKHLGLALALPHPESGSAVRSFLT
jgi:MFS family permease